MWRIKLKIANLVYSRTLHLQATWEIQNQRQEVYCAYLDHTHLFQFRGCARSKPQFLSGSAESEIISLDAGLRVDGLPALQFGECVLETSSSKPDMGNPERHTREKVIPSPSHSANSVFESIDHVPPNIPNSSHSTQLYLFEDNVVVIQMFNKGRSPNLKHVTRTHRVDLDWSFERLNLDHSIVIKYVRTTDKLDTTMQWNSLLILWQIRRPYASKWCPQLFSQTLLLLSFGKAPSVVSGDDTARERWPDMESIRTKSFALDRHLTLEQLSNY